MKSSALNKEKNSYFYSVIIPLFNKGESILATLDSVLCQTYDDYEIVIVNDGSTDDGPEKIKNLKNSKIVFIDQENGGVSCARNTAAASAKGQYLAFLDADDLWLPNYLAEMKRLIATYPSGGGYGADWLYQDGSRQWFDKVSLPNGDLDYFELSLIRNCFWMSAVTMPKRVFFDLGGFDERLSRGEDLELWFRLANRHKIYTTDQKLAIYVQNSLNRACLKPITDYKKCFSYYCPPYKTLTNEPYKPYIFKKAKEFSIVLLRNGDLKQLLFYLKKHFQFGDLYKLLLAR